VFEKTNVSHFATQGTEASDEGTFDCHKFQDRTDIGGSTQETDDRDKWRRFVFDVANSLVLFLLLLFSSPYLSGQILDVYHTSTHGVALARI